MSQEQDVQTNGTPIEDNNEAGTSEKEEALDEGVLSIFGKRILADKVLAPPMHQKIAVRWEEIIKVGLPTNDRTAILQKYPPPSNCNLTNPPKLNAVVKTALPEAAIKRDDRIMTKQEKIAACMAANGKALSNILTNEKENLALVEFLSDSSRLLADMHHDESLVRRSLILANINASVKETLNVSAIDEWLFGSDLDEKLKSRKAMEISCKDIRPIAKNQPPKGTKNVKTPPRQPRTKNLAVTSGGRKNAETARKTARKPYYRPDRRKESSYRRHR